MKRAGRAAGLLLLFAAVAIAQRDARRSGFDDLSPATQALQRDDTQNPAMLWLAEGERLWASGARSCTACHGDAQTAMRGVAARYPAFDGALGRPITLSQRIDECRVRHQQVAPSGPESEPRLALETLLGHASRGMPIAPPADARLDTARRRGEQLFNRRFGQLDLSCAMCHERLAGQRLAGSVIPQGHPTGYPIYRLEWQGMGSLQRRLRGCMTGVRAEPFGADSSEWVSLELFLAQRAAGMLLETPAVRP